MGEDKANISSRRLLLPLQFPTNPPMVVEVEGLGRDFLERVWKLMLISEKIMRTMHGRARVIIENAPCHSATIHSEAPIRHLLAIAKVNFGRRRSKRKRTYCR